VEAFKLLALCAEGTPFDEGIFKLRLLLPDDFPNSAPRAEFITPVFHPNINQSTGAVCVNTLKRDWDPQLTLLQLFQTIRSLLVEPFPDSALNEEAARLLYDDYDAYFQRAKLYVCTHAKVLTQSQPNTLQNDQQKGEMKNAAHVRRKSLKRL
jgi:ubiquitin-conjugating enzyme E2 S